MCDRGRYHEEDIFDIIHSSQNQENEPDDGSQFLNASGERLEEEPRYEEQTNNDGEENLLQLINVMTTRGLIYIYLAGLC